MNIEDLGSHAPAWTVAPVITKQELSDLLDAKLKRLELILYRAAIASRVLAVRDVSGWFSKQVVELAAEVQRAALSAVEEKP